jgi:hypothetical protein
MKTSAGNSQRQKGFASGQKRRKISRNGTAGAAATDPSSSSMDGQIRSRNRSIARYIGSFPNSLHSESG